MSAAKARKVTWPAETATVAPEMAVVLCGARMYYGSGKNAHTIFSDLNMKITTGIIYALLGASGCGKTTLLSCVVGRYQLKGGYVKVLGGIPGTRGSGVPGIRVGYMPQECALYLFFTIKEMFTYYGWVYGMSRRVIQNQIAFLTALLQLPPSKRLIKSLSGGEQRRVSFAIALMHDPELLILDEPTVGLDPLLRQTIWNHLVNIARDRQTTVIISTHYIDEAHQANMIGLLRGGQLLAEASPQKLLEMTRTNSLEEAFFRLSKESTDTPLLNKSTKSKKKGTVIVETDREEVGSTSLREEVVFNNIQKQRRVKQPFTKGKFKALLMKDLLRNWRNPGLALAIFFIPVFQISCFCTVIGVPPKNLNIAIVNMEQIGKSECPVETGCIFINLSCRFLTHLDDPCLAKVNYFSHQSGINAVKAGKAWAVVYMGENFTTTSTMRFLNPGKVADDVLDQSEISIWMDSSEQQIDFLLKRAFHNAYTGFAINLLKDCNQSEKFATNPIRFEKPVFGVSEPSFQDFMIAGVVLSMMFVICLAPTSQSIISEKVEGMRDRAWVAGVTPNEMLLSQFLTEFIALCIKTALQFTAVLMFDIKCLGSYVTIVALILLMGLCGIFLGFIISLVCDQERSAINVAVGLFYPLLFMSGILWPLEAMPDIMRNVSKYTPMTRPVIASRMLFARGSPITSPGVYYGFISATTWTVIFFILTLYLNSFK